ncbi:hypothetical protein HPB50_003785 [Hyalomma asiaticum]|uniref:Uncharacterized protein n=1 Tax=Hyalomma asiaticum TaxID=266040 RepID=A0ACB7S7C0_HYAAI|nr:hypothetical protein HPB50_003785 [Hyalomma asiaticum]
MHAAAPDRSVASISRVIRSSTPLAMASAADGRGGSLSHRSPSPSASKQQLRGIGSSKWKARKNSTPRYLLHGCWELLVPTCTRSAAGAAAPSALLV